MTAPQSSKNPRTKGRPVNPLKRAAIIDAGWNLFLERGVEAVSLETVAAIADVSKATLYKYFPDKTALFEACVLREMERIEAAQLPEFPQQDLRSTLIHFGMGIMSFIVSDYAVAFYNALSGELSRHKDLARRFYNLGPGRTKANLAAILQAAAIPEPQEAAENLFGLWQGFSNFQLSLGVEGNYVRTNLLTRVESGVDLFLRAHGRT